MRIAILLFLFIAVSCKVKAQLKILDVGDSSPGYPPPCSPPCENRLSNVGLELTIEGKEDMEISYSKAAIQGQALHPAQVIFIQLDAEKENIAFKSFDRADSSREKKFEKRYANAKERKETCIVYLSGDSIEVLDDSPRSVQLDSFLRTSSRDTTFEPYQEYYGKIKKKLTFRINSHGMIKLIDTK